MNDEDRLRALRAFELDDVPSLSNEGGENIMETIESRIKPVDAEAWNVLGMSVETAEPAMALAAWQEAIALAPRAPEAHFRLGNFHRRRRDFAAAIVCYRTAVALGLEHPVVLNNLGLALQEQEAFVEAEQCYRAALREQPTLVEANANLGDLFYRQHRF